MNESSKAERLKTAIEIFLKRMLSDKRWVELLADQHELSYILEDIALLLELRNENVFKVRAYQTAAQAMRNYDGHLEDLLPAGRLEAIDGIGKSIAQHIREYLADDVIPYYQQLREDTPPILLELIKIPGLAAKKARVLVEHLDIYSLGELEYACRENRLVSLPGFGSKTQDKILQGIEFMKRSKGKFLLGDAWPLAEKIVEYLRQSPSIEKAVVVGTIRRRVETAEAIDVVIASRQLEVAIDTLSGMPGVAAVLEKADNKQVKLALTTGIPLNVTLVAPEQYAFAVCQHTGSTSHWEHLRNLTTNQGVNIAKTPFTNEADIYELLGMDYIEPELRENNGEFEAAVRRGLPQLIEQQDIRGAFHAHTIHSDGSAGITAMAQAAQKLGWNYIGITDHSQTAVYAGGLKPDAVYAQRREIEQFNEGSKGFRIFAGIESDILPDGSLDYPDEILEQFDFVIASVHSAFRQSQAEMNRRIIRAMNNKYVSMLGHATGRLLLAREAYAINLSEVIQAAVQTGTVIEINANPYRLDLDWRWCRYAKEQGVLLAVNPDAHGVSELQYMKFGVAIARKGWLTAEDIVNTRIADEAIALLRRKRNNIT